MNIVTIDQTDRDTGFSQLLFTVEVSSKRHAQNLMDQLQSHREVVNVKRVYHEKNN